MGKIGRKLFDSFSEDEDSKRVEPDKVEPEKDELEKVVPEKTKQEEVCLEPTEVEAHNEGQKEVEIESSIKKHNWWRDNIISIAALIVSIIVGSISLYFMIKDHKPVDEVEIIKNEIKNNRNKIKALCYKKNGLDELWGDSLICANKISSLMKEMDDVYNNVDLLLNKDPLIAKGMKVCLDAEFVIAVEDLRNYYKENRNVIFNNPNKDYNDKNVEMMIITKEFVTTYNENKLIECEEALLQIYPCREEYLAPYQNKNPDIENYVKAVKKWKNDPNTYRFERILLEHLVHILRIED